MMKPPAPIIPTTNLRVRRPQQKRNNPKMPNQAAGQTPYQSPNLNGGSVGNQITPPASPALQNSNLQPPPANTVMQRGGTASGNTNTAPAPATFNPNDPEQTDNAAMKAIYDLISQGPRSTTADEKQIQDQLAAQTGQGQADLNARMGASGFGTSGALGAASQDMRRQNTLAAQDKILGVRKDSRDEYLSRVMAGLEGEFKDRGMDMSDAQYTNYLKVLEEMANGQKDQDKAEDIKNGNASVGSDSGGSSVGGTYQVDPKDSAKAEKPVESPPAVGWYIGSDSEHDYYVGIDGKIWPAPKAR